MLRVSDGRGRLTDVSPGEVATGFLEAHQYELSVDVADALILVDEVPLTRKPREQAWVWVPGFYAGRVTAEVLDTDGVLIATYGLDVGPSPNKLGKPEFLGMVDEILSTMPALLLGDGAELAQFGQDGEVTSVEVAYARLRRYSDACLAALRVVCMQPLTRLERQRSFVRPHQVRILDARTVQDISRIPEAAQLLGLGQGDAGDLSRITVPHTQTTYDHAANRTIAVMVERLLARAERLGAYFAGAVQRQDERAAIRAPRRIQVLTAFQRELRKVRRSTVFSEVTCPEVSAAGLNAISAHPEYARAYQLSWKALNMGLIGDSVDDALPSGATWQVYERWCFVRVAQLLREIAPDGGWRTVGGGIDGVRRELHGRVNGSTVILHLQPTFQAWDQPSSRDFKSLSRQREPDLVITLESPHARRFLVLDAKYRASRGNVLEAMESAHIYQDSLKWSSNRPWGSFLLLPRDGAVDWLAANAFRTEFRVGTFELAPGTGLTPLTTCLEEFLHA